MYLFDWVTCIMSCKADYKTLCHLEKKLKLLSTPYSADNRKTSLRKKNIIGHHLNGCLIVLWYEMFADNKSANYMDGIQSLWKMTRHFL